MNRVTLACVIITAWLGIIPSALADFRRGNDILQMCESPKEWTDIAYCYGYIDAVIDAMIYGNTVNGFKACVPTMVKNARLIDIVIQFLRLNAARRHFGAAALIANAMSDAYPCP